VCCQFEYYEDDPNPEQWIGCVEMGESTKKKQEMEWREEMERLDTGRLYVSSLCHPKQVHTLLIA
jgi:hypothetical protein